MTVNEIYILLRLRGLTVSDVAKAINVGQSDLSHTLKGKRSNPSIRTAFCEYLGLKVEEVFDDLFDLSAKKQNGRAA